MASLSKSRPIEFDKTAAPTTSAGVGLTSPQDDALLKRKRAGRPSPPKGILFPDSLEGESGGSPLEDQGGPVSKSIREHLSVLAPTHLDLVDDSASHRGHSGAAGYTNGESHFKLHVVSSAFEGLSRVKRHQLVYSSLGDLMTTHVHAMNIKAQTETEFAPPEAEA
jgi:BolA protein